jgi:hypothetical protein
MALNIGGAVLVCIGAAVIWLGIPSIRMPWTELNELVRAACVVTGVSSIIASKFIADRLFQGWLCSMARGKTVPSEFLIILLAKGRKFFPQHPETIRLMSIPQPQG